MGHRRAKMELIENYKTRMLTFRKRKKNLLKKAKEFSILCNVSACVVVFPPIGSELLCKTESWPSCPSDVVEIINKYKMTELPRKSYHVADYFTDKIRRVDSELAKLHKQVCKAKHPSWDEGLEDMSKDHLMMFLAQLELKLDYVDRKLGMMKENMYLMDRVGSRPQAVGSQVGENFYYDLEHFTKAGNVNANPGSMPLIPHFNKLELTVQPDQSSQMSFFNQNLLEFGEASSIGYSANLQVLANIKPLNFQLPVGFQQKQEYSTPKMLEHQGFHDSNIGVGNVQFPARAGLSHFHNSGSWVWDNVLSSGSAAYSSMSYISPLMQSFQSHQNVPLPGFTCPLHSLSQVNELNAGFESEETEQNKCGF